MTAGPTYEPIDPVRFIGNHSSGKMGLEIAKELYARGAEVTLVMGPMMIPVMANGISLVKVKTAAEMFDACNERFGDSDIAVMAAAVADYTPGTVAKDKIKKSDDKLAVDLVRTRDILKGLGEKKKPGQVLVGFALETNNEEANALDKLSKKNADMIVLNSLNDAGAGFGTDTNKITIYGKKGEKFAYEAKPKSEVARDIVEKIIQLHYA